MPEAPEVRRYADELNKFLAGRRIVAVAARTKIAKAWLASHADELKGKEVLRVSAYGKNIIGEIEDGYYFYSHQMMWGRWQIFEGDAVVTADRRERARIQVEGNTALLNSAPVFELGRGDPFEEIPYLGNLGPCALTESVDDFDHIEFITRLDQIENSERTIGDVLLDQTIVCGLGNYLRAEVMFLARLDPWTLVSELTMIDRANLRVLIPSVTNQAYAMNGVTVTPQMRARMTGDSSLVYVPGKEYGTRHYVFRRTNLPCLICGQPVRQLRQEQTHQRAQEEAEQAAPVVVNNEDDEIKTRIVYFCANCQGVKPTLLESKPKKRVTKIKSSKEIIKPAVKAAAKSAVKPATKAGTKTARMTKAVVKDAVMELLHERGEGKTICPSEAARKLSPDNWSELMEKVRQVADEMQSKKLIKITQRGRKIPSAVEAVGPIRLKLW